MENRFKLSFLDDYHEEGYFEDLQDKDNDGTPRSYWFGEHDDFCDVVGLLNKLENENRLLKGKINQLNKELAYLYEKYDVW